MEDFLQNRVEDIFSQELSDIQSIDDRVKPENWQLSPWAVRQYILGGELPNGKKITPKYIGNPKKIELAIATLVTDRALLLIGVPGTAKSWLAEHLAAAISGTSALLVQGTAGTSEEAMRYNWNYARLLSEGPSENALVPSPVMRGMQEGKIVRIEELTRIPSEVQDTLISMLSEKLLPVPELRTSVSAKRGFNLIATANERDKGVHELSSALKRRFNAVQMPLPDSLDEEVEIVQMRVKQQRESLQIPAQDAPEDEIRRLVTVFRELREGKTLDGMHKLKRPTGTLSTAEAISVMNNGLSLAAHFGDGELKVNDWVSGLKAAVIQDTSKDPKTWEEYLEIVIRHRKNWNDFYEACQELGS
ncbi:MAG: AAA family ATPase [Bacteroidota bacterium]